MEETVWKYELPLGGVSLAMPKGARVVHVDDQPEPGPPGLGALSHPTLWAWVDAEAEPEERHFQVIGTGHPLPDPKPPIYYRHVGTAVCSGGQFAWHVFEAIEEAF